MDFHDFPRLGISSTPKLCAGVQELLKRPPVSSPSFEVPPLLFVTAMVSCGYYGVERRSSCMVGCFVMASFAFYSVAMKSMAHAGALSRKHHGA